MTDSMLHTLEASAKVCWSFERGAAFNIYCMLTVFLYVVKSAVVGDLTRFARRKPGLPLYNEHISQLLSGIWNFTRCYEGSFGPLALRYVVVNQNISKIILGSRESVTLGNTDTFITKARSLSIGSYDMSETLLVF